MFEFNSLLAFKKKVAVLLIGFFCFAASTIRAQHATLDRLMYSFRGEKIADTDRVNALNRLSKAYMFIDFGQCRLNALNALALSKKLHYSAGEMLANKICVFNGLVEKSDFESLDAYMGVLADHTDQFDEIHGMVTEAKEDMAHGDYRHAYTKLYEALEISEQSDNLWEETYCNKLLGDVCLSSSELGKARVFYRAACEGARNYGAAGMLDICSKRLVAMDSASGNFKKGLSDFIRFGQCKDSIAQVNKALWSLVINNRMKDEMMQREREFLDNAYHPALGKTRFSSWVAIVLLCLFMGVAIYYASNNFRQPNDLPESVKLDAEIKEAKDALYLFADADLGKPLDRVKQMIGLLHANPGEILKIGVIGSLKSDIKNSLQDLTVLLSHRFKI